jgi:hypothetical protein
MKSFDNLSHPSSKKIIDEATTLNSSLHSAKMGFLAPWCIKFEYAKSVSMCLIRECAGARRRVIAKQMLPSVQVCYYY